MTRRNKVYSYDSLTASAIIGGPLAVFVMSLWNYSVLKKFIKTKKDRNELLSKLVVPTILIAIFIGALFSNSINPIFYVGINIGLIIFAASIWKSMLTSYEKGGGKAHGGVVSIATLVVSLVVSVMTIVGVYYARFDAVGEKPSVLQVIEISINTKFDTSKYNQLITEYTANERQAIGLLDKLTTSSEEQGLVYIEDNKTLWQKNTEVVEGLYALKNVPSYYSNKITKLSAYTRLRVEQSEVVIEFVKNPTQEGVEKLTDITKKVDSAAKAVGTN